METKFHDWINTLSKKGFIPVPKVMCHKFGAEAALLFSEILQREKYFRDRNQLTEEGFYFNTYKDMSSGTGLSEKKIRNLYKLLEQHGLIETKLKGMPRRTHIRVCYENEYDFFQSLSEGIL